MLDQNVRKYRSKSVTLIRLKTCSTGKRHIDCAGCEKNGTTDGIVQVSADVLFVRPE
jgi:hypothetical protein